MRFLLQRKEETPGFRPESFIYGTNDPLVTVSTYNQLKLTNDLHEKLLIERGGHFISQRGKDEGMLHIKDFFDRYLI